MANDCDVQFTGLVNTKSAVVPRSLGWRPNAMVVTASLNQTYPLPTFGVLQIINGTRTLTINDVKVDYYTRTMNGRAPRLVVRLLDRRWRWKYLLISGRYNVYLNDGSISSSTQASLKELAILCLEAMYEVTYDVSMLPDDIYPDVSWSYDIAALELSHLLAPYGYDLCLNWDDTLSIVKLGVGNALPATDDLDLFSVTTDLPEMPDQLVLVCGPTQYQAIFRLIAVGEDVDGSVVPINLLSYTPAGGWPSLTDPAYFSTIGGLSKTEIELAKKTIYRWYAIESLADGTLTVPGYGTINDISQVIPTNSTLIQTSFAPAGSSKNANNCQVLGKFRQVSDPPADQPVTTMATYGGRFRLVREQNIVKFPTMVNNYDSGTGEIVAAELYLKCSFGIRENDSLKIDRQTFSYNLTPAGAPLQEVIKVDELAYRFVALYNEASSPPTWSGSYTDNLSDLEAKANSILTAAAQKYVLGDYEIAKYRLLQPINPDGAIRQVVVTISDDQGCYTQASRNTEVFPGVHRASARRKDRLIESFADLLTIKRHRARLEEKGLYR